MRTCLLRLFDIQEPLFGACGIHRSGETEIILLNTFTHIMPKAISKDKKITVIS
jgi:hypothetical protein